ncbi:hypothetical protein SUGI_0873740 [Cryptomeria japonica]|nr:hypothetical protein SUGI_0873740 [Cryptomeria japonica]
MLFESLIQKAESLITERRFSDNEEGIYQSSSRTTGATSYVTAKQQNTAGFSGIQRCVNYARRSDFPSFGYGLLFFYLFCFGACTTAAEEC